MISVRSKNVWVTEDELISQTRFRVSGLVAVLHHLLPVGLTSIPYSFPADLTSIHRRFRQVSSEQRKVGHVGLAESLVFLADGLGWKLDEVQESLDPAIATQGIKTEFLTVTEGGVAGVRQFARGLSGGKELLTLELQMYVGAPNPRDVIEIVGEPPLRLVIEGGVPGDVATPAILVNTLPRLMECPAGLHTMRTLGLPRMAR